MNRAVIQGRCQRCRADVLLGYDADTAALLAVVDNAPLTRSGELLAVVAGRLTYRLDIAGHLHHRRWLRIKTPAVGQTLAQHRCGEAIPSHWRQPPKPQPMPTNTTEVPF